MKKLIYQVYVREKDVPLYDFCTASVKAYADRIGAEYYVQTTPRLKIMPDMSRTNRNKNGIITCGYLPILEKENAFDHIYEYDQIAVIDADIYVRESAPDIFDELGTDHDWGGVLERDLPLTEGHRRKIQGYSRDMFDRLKDVDWNWNNDGAEFMNMGVMVFNKSIIKYLDGQSAKEFLLRPEFKDFIDGIGLWKYSTDQVMLNYWLKKSGAKVKHLDWRFNTMYRGAVDGKIPEAHFVHFFLKQQIPGQGNDIGGLKKILGV